MLFKSPAPLPPHKGKHPLHFPSPTSVPPLEYIPRRAMMYVPGSDDRKLTKIPTLGCDCAVMDMEDGVAQNRKQEARLNIVKALSAVSSEYTFLLTRLFRLFSFTVGRLYNVKAPQCIS